MDHPTPTDDDLDDYLVGEDLTKGVSFWNPPESTVIQLDFDNPIVNLPEVDLIVFEWGGTPDTFALAVGDGSDFSEYRTHYPQHEFNEGGRPINPASVELSDFSYLPSVLTSIRITLPGGAIYPDIAGAATMIPEPMTLSLFALGGLAMIRRRRDRKA